ncbi:MAG: BatD family protein [Planctomycetota bacterium]
MSARLALLVTFFLTLLAGVPHAQDEPRLSVRVEPPTGEVGLRMSITISVDGPAGADCALIEAPLLDGARLTLSSGPITSSSTTIVNGRVSRSLRTEWRFMMIPERVGKLEVGPFGFNCRGVEHTTRPVSVQVVESARPEDVVALEILASTDELWMGQAFSIEVRASIDEASLDMLVPNGTELDLPWLDGTDGLMRLDQPLSGQNVNEIPLAGRNATLGLRVSRDATGERPQYVFTRTLEMLATSPGRIELPESRFSATIATEVQSRNDPFSLTGRRLVATRTAVADARAPGPVLTVRAPPEEGRPASFTNAVGTFQLSGSASPTTLRVGETCTLKLVLTGAGNLDFVNWPSFEGLARDFRVFGKNERKQPDARILEIEISPKNDRVEAVPQLELAAFDPDVRDYVRLAVGPWSLDVSPGGEAGLADLESPSDALSSLETIRESLPEPRGEWPAWVWCVPGAVLLLAVDVRRRRDQWRRRNPGEVARRAARARLDQALGKAGGARDVAVAFGHFLAARLDGPPAGLTAEEAAQRLDDQDLGEALRRTVGSWEAAYLGGAPFDLAAGRDEARALADRVEART